MLSLMLACALIRSPGAEPAALPISAVSWQSAFARMPLTPAVRHLHRTNCVEVMLGAFRRNPAAKALVFMPGATDELYFFRRARAEIPASSPTLLDAVTALTNQTLIRATFRAPFLLLHTEEDPIEPEIHASNPAAAQKIHARSFATEISWNDRDWNFVQPILEKSLRIDIKPWPGSLDSWHFYRHSLAAFDLSGWEALELICLAGKTRATIRRHWNLVYPQNQIMFEGDTRVRAVPRVDVFPRD